MVLTGSGLVEAKNIKVGDTLLTVDANSIKPETNSSPLEINLDELDITRLVHTKVTNVIVSDKIDRVYFNENEETQFTETHPIFVKRNNKYCVVEAGLVLEGDILININMDALEENPDILKLISEIEVYKVNKISLESPAKVYTFSCDPYNWYFAGTILTHNK